MREALDEHVKGERPSLDRVESQLGKISDGARALQVLDALDYKQPEPAASKRRRRRRG
jgi:5-methyltetrahydrofolate--homocysteine methyltransferase